MKRGFIRSIFFIFFLLGIATGYCQAAIKVAVLPFKVHAAEDLSYVREGILDMMTTRIFKPDEVIVIDKTLVQAVLKDLSGPLTEAKARAIGERLGVDYVLFGSLTVFGQNVSLDAQMIPVKAGRQPIALYTETRGLDEVIPKLATFARKIDFYLTGKPTPAPLAAQSVPSSQIASTSPTQGASPRAEQVTPNRMHPERFWRESSTSETPEAKREHLSSSTPSNNQRAAVKQPKPSWRDIDPWPDYPPDEEQLGPIVEEPRSQKVEKPKKKRNWLGWIPFIGKKKKEKEVVLTPHPQESTSISTPEESSPEAQTSPSPPAPGEAQWQWY
ncbi:hypothetical protein [Thermosulfuriphilus sp.]